MRKIPAGAARVLVVDDDESDVALIREAFSAHRLPVDLHVAADGVEALEYLRGPGRLSRPDMVLLDLNMPRMDGREVLSAVKSNPDLRSIPIVVFTTSGQPPDIAASYDRHANAFVTKPLDLDEFIAAVECIHDFYGEMAARPARPGDSGLPGGGKH